MGTADKAMNFLRELRLLIEAGEKFLSDPFVKEVLSREGRRGEFDPYSELGVKPDDPDELIREIYLKKSLFYHPDRGGDEEKMKKLNKAYDEIRRMRGL